MATPRSRSCTFSATRTLAIGPIPPLRPKATALRIVKRTTPFASPIAATITAEAASKAISAALRPKRSASTPAPTTSTEAKRKEAASIIPMACTPIANSAMIPGIA